jgi:universal stress protein E
MAFRLKKILVAIRDTTHTPRAMLRKAAALAKASGATVELFHAISAPVSIGVVRGRKGLQSPQQTMDAMSEDAKRKLDRMARSVFPRNARVTSQTTWDYPPHEAIVRRALATRADLVIAAAHQGRLARLFVNYTDWELIRHCPVPVLLVKSTRDYNRPVIVAAVDPFHARAKPAALDARLLEASVEWARLLKGEAHSFHAYQPLVAMVPTGFGAPLPLIAPDAEDEHGRQIRKALGDLSRRAGIPPARQHVMIGDVPSTLVAVVRRTKASLVVMGAISRSRLSRVFIGNTAEQVLDRLPCDALILKPRDFRTTITAGRR